MAAKRCIFLAGAPEGEGLSWDEPALSSSFDAPIKRFLEDSTTLFQNTLGQTAPSTSLPKWRSIGLDDSNVQVSWPSQEQNQSVRGYATTETDLVDSDFLEHSIAFLEHLDSSQIIGSTAANGLNTHEDNEATFASFNTTTSLTDTSLQSIDDLTDATSSTQKQSELIPNIQFTGEIMDLKRIPHAEHIQRMLPQTITVNLLVGIIAISPARRVQLRRRKLERDIIEITVGDETRAGFSISFWLVPEEGRREQASDDLRKTLRALRSGQVVLLQSVALSCFRGSVYGQSLSRRFARNSTTVAVLDNDGFADRMSHSSVSKLQRVRAWTADFVGAEGHASNHLRDGRREGLEREALPPDTQD